MAAATKSTAPAKPKHNGLLSDFFKSLVAATEPETLRQVATDAMVRKAMETDGAEGDDGDVRILDQEIGSMEDKVPPAGQVPCGPAQASSGAGAERMIREYSKPDPQQDIVARYEELSRELGSLRGYLKSLTEGMAALMRKADDDEEDNEEDEEQSISVAVEQEDEEDEEDEEEAKSLPKSYRKLIPELAAAMLRKAEDDEDEDDEDDEEQSIDMADEEAEEDDEDDEESAKAINPYTRIYLAKATWLAARAALADANPKMRKAVRKRLEKATEAALRKAWRLLKKAEDEEKKDDDDEKESESRKSLRKAIRKSTSKIAEYAYLRGIALKKAPAKKKDKKPVKKAESAESDLGKEIPDNNQTKWPTETDTAPGAVMKGEIEKVLAGQAMMNASVSDLLKIVAGTSKPQNLTVTELTKSQPGVQPGVQPPPNTVTLAKAGSNDWMIAKSKAIEDAIQSGAISTLNEELAAGSILATAQAVAGGSCDADTLQARVRTSDGAVREIFRDLLEG